ncbi:ankyrin repeat domain-containing protein [Alteromonas sp. ASW11-130]|uniref:ankyrin repeat domain-containing protein n=1 Tax=Alteromonas sp. ASW11-130 TaxID=3015775 RepID=UPI0022422354|nr:ankyrin repeat domain-containing protein [Alteromonas sp. ASW11-130]MCW8091132.1 ankyrin repeat domain-containing protein [Alteromonas sp. ASW11-130]
MHWNGKAHINQGSILYKWFLVVLIILTISGCHLKTVERSNLKPKDFFSDKEILEFAKYVSKENVEKIDTLASRGIDVNAVRKDGMTLLFYALSKKNKKAFSKLLKRGASPNMQIKNGDSVMNVAAVLDDNFYLKEALKHGGNPNVINSKSQLKVTPIFDAIYNDKLSNVKVLVEAGADLEYENYKKHTPLLLSASINNWEITYYLLLQGANYKQMSVWNTGLVFLLENNNIGRDAEMFPWREKVVEFIREKGVEVNPRSPL